MMDNEATGFGPDTLEDTLEIENSLAQKLRLTEHDSACDAACKELLSEKSILAHIMKDCLEEYRDCAVSDIREKYIERQPQVSIVPVMPDETNAMPIIDGVNIEETSRTEGKIVYDIRYKAIAPASDGVIRLIITMDAQNEYYPGYPQIKRAIYYGSRAISSQYGREFTNYHYEKIKKVYTIFICSTPPKKWENTITRYRITEENVVGEVRELVQNYDLLTVVMVCLGNPQGKNANGVLRLLDVLFSNEYEAARKQEIMKNDFDIPMTETLERKVIEVCNLSQGFEERGRIKGFAEGRTAGFAEGRSEGHAEGRTEGMLASIRSLMDSMDWTIEQAMAALKVSEEDRPKYAKLLNN